MATVDPQPPKKRPLYLVAALALSFALGTGGWVGGCESIGYYHGDTNLSHTDLPLKDESYPAGYLDLYIYNRSTPKKNDQSKG